MLSKCKVSLLDTCMCWAFLTVQAHKKFGYTVSNIQAEVETGHSFCITLDVGYELHHERKHNYIKTLHPDTRHRQTHERTHTLSFVCEENFWNFLKSLPMHSNSFQLHYNYWLKHNSINTVSQTGTTQSFTFVCVCVWKSFSEFCQDTWC